MYRINVLTTGKYDNVVRGYRYTFSHRKAKKFVMEVIREWECECTVEKFSRCGNLCENLYCWAPVLENEIFEEYRKRDMI